MNKSTLLAYMMAMGAMSGEYRLPEKKNYPNKKLRRCDCGKAHYSEYQQCEDCRNGNRFIPLYEGDGV